MGSFAPTLENLIEQFRSLPGIGHKSAIRLAFHIINTSEEQVIEFSDCLLAAKKHMKKCDTCKNVSDTEVCPICSDDKRDRTIICVVESPRDVITFEKIKEYSGVYHVLHGVISPLDGISPDDIHLKELVARCADNITEVIVATGSTVEGEATGVYISKLLKPLGIKTTRLAFGLPVGGELEYADEMTLFKALEGRREI